MQASTSAAAPSGIADASRPKSLAYMIACVTAYASRLLMRIGWAFDERIEARIASLIETRSSKSCARNHCSSICRFGGFSHASARPSRNAARTTSSNSASGRPAHVRARCPIPKNATVRGSLAMSMRLRSERISGSSISASSSPPPAPTLAANRRSSAASTGTLSARMRDSPMRSRHASRPSSESRTAAEAKAIACRSRSVRNGKVSRGLNAAMPGSTKSSLAKIEEENLRVLRGADRKRRLVPDRGAVALLQRCAVDLDAAARHLNPSAAAGAQRVLDTLALVEQRGVNLRVLMDVERTVLAVRRDQEPQRAALFVEELLLVARRDLFDGGQDPDLEEVHRLGARAIELAVHDPRAGAHALHFAAAQDALAARRVLVRERPFHHDRDDLHVLVPVRAEALPGRDGVFVDHAQRAEAHVRGVVVVGEGEGVARGEPAVPADAAVVGFANGDHDPMNIH